MTQKIIVEIEYDENIPDISSRYTASINDENNKIVVTAKSVAECFEEIAITMLINDIHSKK